MYSRTSFSSACTVHVFKYFKVHVLEYHFQVQVFKNMLSSSSFPEHVLKSQVKAFQVHVL